MNDKEFSPTPAEFSPPRPEFSAPPREWAAPGNEISRDDTAPPQKKRRSLPAMLVAGAAAVAIGLSCWGAAVTDNTPRAALTAEQCAYLDAVSEALLEEDIPGLEALALDPMMRQLCEEVIEPYYYDVLLPYERGDLVNRIHQEAEIGSMEHTGDGTLVAGQQTVIAANDVGGSGEIQNLLVDGAVPPAATTSRVLPTHPQYSSSFASRVW